MLVFVAWEVGEWTGLLTQSNLASWMTLFNLYQCDLRRETHQACDVECLVCAKLAILVAIEQYRAMKNRVVCVVADV